MKKLLKKFRLWLGLEEPNWWDELDADPIHLIEGEPLAAALNHRRATA